MFYNTYKKKINNCYLSDNVYYNKILLRCCLCLEDDNMDLFYNYENNKFIHNCKCTPNIHYKCFKSLYNVKSSCIICNEKIYSKNLSSISYMKSFLKYSILFIIFYEIIVYLLVNFYNIIIDFDFIDKLILDNLYDENFI